MALEGTLRDMPLADLFDVFRAGQRSGRLQVSRQQERGLIFIGAGQLLDAVLVTDLNGDNVAHAEEAVIRILNWAEASFTFEHDPTIAQRPRRIERDAAWFFSAIARTSHAPVSMRSRLRPAALDHGLRSSVTLSADEWRLLSALWAQHTLSMVCVELELESHQVLPLAQSMVERGLLTIVEEREPRRAHSAEPPQQPGAAPLRHIASAQPAAAPRSQLLQAIIRRVRTL